MDLDKFTFLGPKNHEKIGHKIFVLHPIFDAIFEFLIPFRKCILLIW